MKAALDDPGKRDGSPRGKSGAAELARVNRALKTLSAGNHTLLHASDEGELLHAMCRVIVEEGGYRCAWVGYAQHDERKTIRVMACAGIDPSTIESHDHHWADTELGYRAAGTAIRTGQPCIGRNILTDPAYASVREDALREGYAAATTFPLRIGEEVIGNLSILAAEPDAFDEAEVKLLGELADDLAYGIGTLRARLARERTEAELARVNRALRTLSAGNRTLLRTSDEQELLSEMCRVIVEEGGYRMAWVGYAQHDEQQSIRPMAIAGFDAGFVEASHFTWADSGLGLGPTGTAVRTGQPVIGRNVLTDPDLVAWREEALKRGYAAASAFPLRINGELIGNLSITAVDPDAFDETEARLLGELAEDLSYGIANLRIRAKHQEAEKTIERMAYYDSLTGLPNRALLREHLQQAIELARQQHRSLALLLLKLDQFQEINDTLGYREGDALLREIPVRLGGFVRQSELLARVGEDEFAVLLPSAGAEYATQAAHRMVRALYEPLELAGLTVDSRACIGIALFPGHGADPDALIRRANVAAYQAKRTARGYAIYVGSEDQECTRRLALMGDLRRAIERNELLLYCQPKVDLASGHVCGAEALVRWPHSQYGMLFPEEFIKLAEHGGLITPLTHWVLEAAFSQSYAWQEAGVNHPLSVNLSAHDLRDPRLLERIKGLFATWGTRPDRIQFELTESALMVDPAGALATLARLKDLGVELFIDDFGSGYSSLSYLQKLPVDSIKIDQSFVGSMLAHEDSAIIVRSTIDLGHNLDLEVVAEGVESEAVWDRLAALGCDTAQGYYIGMPIPTGQFKEWEEHSRWHS